MNKKEKNDSVLSASEGQVQAPSSEPTNAADNDFLRSLSDLRATDLKNGTDTKTPKKKRTPPQVLHSFGSVDSCCFFGCVCTAILIVSDRGVSKSG